MFVFTCGAVHAAVIAINEAIEHQVAQNTMAALRNPAAHLNNMYADLADMYQNVLYDAKQTKAEIARNKVKGGRQSGIACSCQRFDFASSAGSWLEETTKRKPCPLSWQKLFICKER